MAQHFQPIKVLGVPTIMFTHHISAIVSKAKSRSYLTFKCFISRNRRTLPKAHVIFVCPTLEYAIIVWSQLHIGDIKRLESVQRNFTKRIPDSLRERLQILGLDSLQLNRLRYDLVFVYKFIFGLVQSDTANFIEFKSSTSIT